MGDPKKRRKNKKEEERKLLLSPSFSLTAKNQID